MRLVGIRQDFFVARKEAEALKPKAQIMDEAALNRALMRISHEIVEKNRGAHYRFVLPNI